MSDISSIIIHIMPYALGAAVSPVVLAGFLLILSLSKNPRLPGFAFYLGSIALLLIIVFVGILVGDGLIKAGAGDPKTTASIDVVLGVILIFLALRNFAVKEQGQQGGIFKYLKSEDEASKISAFTKFFAIGFIMFLINFSTDILVLAAGKDLGLLHPELAAAIAAIIILTIITLLVIEIPFGLYLISPKTAAKILSPLRDWINKNGNYLTGAIILIIGLYILIKGVRVLGLI